MIQLPAFILPAVKTEVSILWRIAKSEKVLKRCKNKTNKQKKLQRSGVIVGKLSLGYINQLKVESEISQMSFFNPWGTSITSTQMGQNAL